MSHLRHCRWRARATVRIRSQAQKLADEAEPSDSIVKHESRVLTDEGQLLPSYLASALRAEDTQEDRSRVNDVMLEYFPGIDHKCIDGR